jgi:hypothetical protein
MVEETKRHLTTNTKPDIYFFATKVDGEIEMDMLIDQFTEYDNKFYPHLNKYKNEYIIEFLNWEQDLDPSYICSDINHFFLEQYSEYGEHRDEWDDLRRKFYGTADWWKGKYSIEEILEFTEDNFD